MYVTDTHPWLWFLSSDERLSERAEGVFDSVEQGEGTIVVPSIVIAESIYISDKKGYSLEMKKIIQDLELSSNYVMRPLDYPVLKEISVDDRAFSIHDKIIVNTGEKRSFKIISKDEKIQEKARVEVVW